MNVVESLIIAGATGAVSTLGTVIALKVHISYLREGLARLERSINRAHHRIDEIEQNGVKACFNGKG